MNKIAFYCVTIAALVLITLGGSLIWGYGKSKYNEGYSKANAEASEAAIKESKISSARLERIKRETKNISDPDIDGVLLDFGIMRSHAD